MWPNRPPTHTEFLGFGESVSINTMIRMKDIINKAQSNYQVRQWAEKIASGLPNDDYVVAKEIYEFLGATTQYRKDPYDVELIRSPEIPLQLIQAGDTPSLDCDDFTILSLSLLKILGIQVAMRAASYQPDHILTHIYGLCKVRGQWTPFDLVKLPGFGNEHPGITATKDIEV